MGTHYRSTLDVIAAGAWRKGHILKLTLPLSSRLSYALISDKVHVSTNFNCLHDSDEVSVPGISDDTQDASVLGLSKVLLAPTSSCVPVLDVLCLTPIMGVREAPSTWARAV